ERRVPAVENLDEWLAQRNAAEMALTSREEVEKVFRAGTEEVFVALDSLKPEDIDRSVDSGVGWSMPMTFLMNLPGRHALSHAAQIDYLQTCWDDQEVHF
ncbi:MAG: hypothetical protein ABUL49_00980, partial [bacterium]